MRSTEVKYVITLDKENENILDINNSLGNQLISRKNDFHSLGTMAKESKRFIIRPFAINRNALILFTSGTTGKR